MQVWYPTRFPVLGVTVRTGRDLIEASREFSTETRARSWWHLISTTAVLIAGVIALAQPLAWSLRLALAVVTGLVVVREFILYHDYLHCALLRGSKAARLILYPFGIYVM